MTFPSCVKQQEAGIVSRVAKTVKADTILDCCQLNDAIFERYIETWSTL